MQQLITEIALRDYLVGIGPMIIGVLIVLVLIGAVALGLWLRDREPEPPQEPQLRGGAWETREEHERGTISEDHGPGHQDLAQPHIDEQQNRAPHDVPRDGIRRMPYEFGTSTEPVEEGGEPSHRKWDRGGSSHGTG
jgi:hypothetical protein